MSKAVTKEGGVSAETDFARAILAGERRALARAITLAESTRADHREMTLRLLKILREPPFKQALRIGLSGTPGVGKSTLTETLGMMLIDEGLKVAVLAVDPSSARSGGSILGDKTRMERLSREKNAYIRPSPNQLALGGVARRTREAITLCEAAGYDVVLVETVGVGQSETMVADLTDIFVLLLAPAGGDELQGVKRGIMEICDMILVNKADGDLKPAATRTCADYAGALRLLRKRPQDPEGMPCAAMVSALSGDGLAEAWDRIRALAAWRKENGHWQDLRARQAQMWFDAEVKRELLADLEQNEAKRQVMADMRARVATGQLSPEEAAVDVLVVLGQK